MRKIYKVLLMLMGCVVFSSVVLAADMTVEQFFNGKCSRGFAVVSAPYKGEDATKPIFENYCFAVHLVYKCNRDECNKPLKNHTSSDVYGIVICKYNEPEKIVWATNFKWVVKTEGFYEFLEGYRVEPWGPTIGYEKIFIAVKKLFQGPIMGQEAVDAFLRKDTGK
ncbi:MAG: hypothetical protein AAB397_01470 [Patescibacteria group bacterium]